MKVDDGCWWVLVAADGGLPMSFAKNAGGTARRTEVALQAKPLPLSHQKTSRR